MGEGPVMDEEAELVESLTVAELETPRALLTTSKIKEVARVLDISPHTVEQRLKRARARLGVSTSIDGAHMVARVEGRMYGLPVYANSDVAEGAVDAASIDLAEKGRERLSLPFPTKGRPWNDSSIWVRVIAIAAGTLIATVSALLAASLLETINRIARQIL